jgi:adenylyl- and sulfurtransferase ThiI
VGGTAAMLMPLLTKMKGKPMSIKKVLLVKYGEISLRKGNRAHFEHGLLNAIRANLKEINDGNIRVVREQGRFLIENKTCFWHYRVLPGREA